MKVVFYEKQLYDLIRANKDRKLRLAIKAGYSSIEEYKEDLELLIKNSDKEDDVVASKKIIHNVIISDASGSMNGSKYSNTKNGIELEIKEFKSNNEITVLHSLYEFVERGNLKNPYKDSENPKPTFCGAKGGNTPLWSSIVTVLKAFQNVPKEEKVLVKIFTDGGNNTDYGYEEECRNLIKKLNNENFTITFVATVYDMPQITRIMKLDKSNTLTIENSGTGFETAYKTSLTATKSYATKVVKGEDVKFGFYKEVRTL